MKKPLIRKSGEGVKQFYCHICGRYYPASESLMRILIDERAEYLAYMAAHYLHMHEEKEKRKKNSGR